MTDSKAGIYIPNLTGSDSGSDGFRKLPLVVEPEGLKLFSVLLAQKTPFAFSHLSGSRGIQNHLNMPFKEWSETVFHPGNVMFRTVIESIHHAKADIAKE